MKYSYGVVHANVSCLDCNWETGSYKNAQAIAKIHARIHHHRVTGELGIAFEYDGREEKSEEKED
jgi:hypothetical protein